MDFITSIAAGVVATGVAAAIAWFYKVELERTRRENARLKTDLRECEKQLRAEQVLRQQYENAYEVAYSKFKL